MNRTTLMTALLVWVCTLGSVSAQEQAAAPQAADQQTAEQDEAPAQVEPAEPSDADAAVRKLRAEIDAMLTPEGLVAADDAVADGAGYDQRRRRIAEIAATSNTIAGEHEDDPDLQYVARQNEMRAYHALAQDAAANGRPAEASYRLTQLRNAAQETRDTDNAYAPATGGYWLLVADLTDLNRAAAPVAQRQPRAIERLSAYLAAHPDGQTPEAIGTQVRMALVRLYDQAGRNAEACAQLADLRQRLDADDARLAALADVAATCERVGKPVELELDTIDGSAWSLADHAGRRVLIHVYADWAPQSKAVFEALSGSRAALAEAGVSVLSLSVGPTRRTAAQQAWPIGVASAKEGGVLDGLGVRGVPWLMVIDAEGNLARVGRTAHVIDSLLAAPTEPEDATNADNAGADSP